MKKGEIATGTLSALSFLGATDAYFGTGGADWLIDLCFTGDAPPMSDDIFMPMEDHSAHTAYYASAGLTFLAAMLGWEWAEERLARFRMRAPMGKERKRMLAVIIYLSATAGKTNRRIVDDAFFDATGHQLTSGEGKEAFLYLNRKEAPGLRKILSGRMDESERRRLLVTAVKFWERHGMDSENTTLMVENIVEMLGFEQDDICKVLDRKWLYQRIGLAAQIAWAMSKKAAEATKRALSVLAVQLTPLAMQLKSRAFTAIQR